MSPLFAAWITEASIITYRAFTRNHRPPLPSEFVASFVIYGALGMVAESATARPAAVAVGWGLVIATALRFGPADFNQAADALAGGTSSSTPATRPAASERVS